VFESAELNQRVSKQEFAEQLPALRAAALAIQERLAGSDRSVVIVIAGAEGSGKGVVVNTLLEWLDARGIEAHALGPPTSEEAERPRLFRFWRHLPQRGHMGIFFGSWYTAPIVDHAFGAIDDNALDRELDRIVDFERMLVAEGVIVVKLWLHVTKKRQRAVFRKLESNPDTAWRVTSSDWEYHATYDEFVESSARTLRQTDTARAPWHVIAAHNRRYCLLTAGRHLISAMEKRLDEPAAPALAPEVNPVPKPVNIINSLDLSQCLEKDEYEERLSSAQGRLGRAARKLTASDRAAVLVFEGADAGGKGGAIRRIIHALDARWYRVVPVAAPTDEERARPYLWRFWRRLPGHGQFTIYDRSWYGRVLVERVENLCPPEAWRRAFHEINAFEEQLEEKGILVFKFWLAISPEEQLRRFEERHETPYKQYKITPEDWRNREKWLAYEAAACEMVERTNSDIAPWTLVAANDKYHARVTVLETLCDGLDKVLKDGKREKKSKRGEKKNG
jgi:polyphosphate:AMP phosphotransferase